MYDTLYEACDIFKINTIQLETISLQELRKKYHKLCLKYHPDKNKNSHDMFLKVKKSYETILEYKNREESTNICDSSLYTYFASFLEIRNIEKIIEWIETQYKKEIIYLHVDWEQVIRKDVFFHNNIYIPLWFQTYYNEKDLYYVKVRDLPENIRQTETNDLIVYENIRLNHSYINKKISISISKTKKIDIICDKKIIENSYHICLHQGIPRMCKENIYDTSEISHVIVLFKKNTI